MSWTRDDFAPAFVDVGMWTEAHVEVAASGDSHDVFVGLREPDSLFVDDAVQSTHYRLKFETTTLPMLAVDDLVTISGDDYRVKSMPAFVGTGWFSTCDLTRVTRSYPKQPIALTESGAPLNPGVVDSSSEFINKVATQALTAHRVVVSVGALGCDHASNLVHSHGDRIIGLTMTDAPASGRVVVQNEGEHTNGGWSWTPELPVFLGIDGLLTQTAPDTPALFSARIGHAMSATKIFIDIKTVVYLG